MHRIPPPPTCSMVPTLHSTKSTNVSKVDRFSVDSRRKARELIAKSDFVSSRSRLLSVLLSSSRQFPANSETSSRLSLITRRPVEIKFSKTSCRSFNTRRNLFQIYDFIEAKQFQLPTLSTYLCIKQVQKHI